jgi:uncharacterized protein involved in exopolysaccharide biosynthesis
VEDLLVDQPPFVGGPPPLWALGIPRYRQMTHTQKRWYWLLVAITLVVVLTAILVAL